MHHKSGVSPKLAPLDGQTRVMVIDEKGEAMVHLAFAKNSRGLIVGWQTVGLYLRKTMKSQFSPNIFSIYLLKHLLIL